DIHFSPNRSAFQSSSQALNDICLRTQRADGYCPGNYTSPLNRFTVWRRPVSNASKEGKPPPSYAREKNPTFVPWPGSGPVDNITCMKMTTILMIYALTILLFGFDSNSRHYSTPFPC